MCTHLSVCLVHVRLHVCICVHICNILSYVRMSVCEYAGIDTRTYVCVCARTDAHHWSVPVHARSCAVRSRAHRRAISPVTCTHTYTHIHTYIHTPTHPTASCVLQVTWPRTSTWGGPTAHSRGIRSP